MACMMAVPNSSVSGTSSLITNRKTAAEIQHLQLQAAGCFKSVNSIATSAIAIS